MVVICVLVVHSLIQSPVKRYVNATGGEIDKSAQYLSELAEKEKLAKPDIDKILSILRPRLLNMADRIRSKKKNLDIYVGELRLAWQLILRSSVSPSEAGILLQMLNPSWSVYEKKNSNRPAKIELLGRLVAPPQGIVIHHKVWFVVEEKQQVLGLEGFLCTGSKGIADINWGLERLTQFDIDGKTSLLLSKQTTVYLIPAQVAEELPTGQDDADKIEIFKKAVAHEGARKLCSFQQATVLKEENNWRNNFNFTSLNSTATSTVVGELKDADSFPDREIESVRNELRNAWDNWHAWGYFWDWREFPQSQDRFLEFRRANDTPMPQVWILFVAKRESELQKINEHFSVSPKLAQEFADFYNNCAISEERMDETFAKFEDVLFKRSVKLLNEFLINHPDSVFCPEVNFRIAEIIGRGPLPENSRTTTTRELQSEYYKRAVEGYGEKFCYHAEAARANLANWADSIPALLFHYEWQMNFIDNGTIGDIYPIQSIHTFIKGRNTRIPKERLVHFLKSAKKNIKQTVSITIRTIVRRANPLELEQIIRKYPNTLLAEKAEDPECVLHNRSPKELRDLINAYPNSELSEFARELLQTR
jgi:hypothetical protein